MKRVAMAAVAVAVLASGCETFEAQGPRAVAKLEAAKGNPVWGSVSFVETGGVVLVRADVRGLRAGGEFGFHVHEKGDCSCGGLHERRRPLQPGRQAARASRQARAPRRGPAEPEGGLRRQRDLRLRNASC